MSEVLVNATRGTMVESVHRGDVAVVDHTGRVLYSVGDPERATFIRSAAKPGQALPIVESGAADHYQLTERELAIMCASHNAESFHTDTVLGILKKIGLDESALQCGVHAPYDLATANQLVREGRKPTAIHCNCSGKHSGMLTLAQHMGWPVEGYYKPDHPVQLAGKASVARMADYPEEKIVIGTDGCGVPVFGMPIRNMATMFAQFANPVRQPEARQQAIKRIIKAVNAAPEMIAGTARFNSDLIRAGRGRYIAKSGAEGVFCVGVVGAGIGICTKTDDGNSRPHPVVIVNILKELGYLDAEAERELEKWTRAEVRNHRNEICGRLERAFELQKR